MAISINANGSSVTLSKYLKILCLSLKQENGYLYKIYSTVVLLVTAFLYVAGIYFKLSECILRPVVLRYLDLFLHQIRFTLNVIDLILPLFAGKSLLQLTEVIDTTTTSQKKTIFYHTLLNYCFIICQLIFQVISTCYFNKTCTILCFLPYLTNYSLMTAGFLRCICVLVLLKRRIFEVSGDLSKKLIKIVVGDSLIVNIRQVDELLEGIHAFGKCFGIQIALQFMNFEGMVISNVVLVKKVSEGVPLYVYLLLMETILVSGVGWDLLRDGLSYFVHVFSFIVY